MSQLYDVSFTTIREVNVLDHKGKIIEKKRMDRAITIGALPWATAQSYSQCDNFVCKPYEPDQGRSSSRHGWGGAATKKVDREAYARNEATPKARSVKPKSGVQSAAETGDLSAAINA